MRDHFGGGDRAHPQAVLAGVVPLHGGDVLEARTTVAERRRIIVDVGDRASLRVAVAEIEQPGIGPYPMPGLPFEFSAAPREPTRPAPRLGEHTDAVLSEVLGLSSAEIARLHDSKIIAGPDGR